LIEITLVAVVVSEGWKKLLNGAKMLVPAIMNRVGLGDPRTFMVEGEMQILHIPTDSLVQSVGV